MSYASKTVSAVAGMSLLAAASVWAGATQTFTEAAVGIHDPVALSEERLELHRQLMAARVEAGLQTPLEVQVSAQELDAVLERSPLERRIKVGLAKPVRGVARLSVGAEGRSPRSRSERLEFGAVRVDRDGYVWSGALHAAGAAAVRAHVQDLDLPEGAELFFYNLEGEAFGPYTRRGPFRDGAFWSNTVTGPLMAIQIRYQGPAVGSALQATRLRISEVGYLTPKFQLALRRGAVGASGVTPQAFCSFNESCVENAECSSIPGPVQSAQDAVAQILFRSGGFFFICSGGLLTDTDDGSTIPYFLTANHCVSKGQEANSLEAFFQFTTPCGGGCYDPDGVVPSTLGSVIRATGRNADFTLLELAEPAPAGSAFLGWTTEPVAFADGVELFRISHPSGAPQAYSEHSVDVDAPTCSQWPRGQRIYSRDTFGATEGGSSGSPVLLSTGQVVGQLSGACGFNVGDVCDAESNATVDGAFAAYFDEVAPFLEPDGGGGGDCELGQNGDPCTFDGDCCSLKCRGKPGSQTCKGS